MSTCAQSACPPGTMWQGWPRQCHLPRPQYVYALVEGRVMVQLPRAAITSPAIPITFAVRLNGGPAERIDSSFLGPVAKHAAPPSGH